MKSTYETEIDIPRLKLAGFYANPENNVKWMTDLDRCEYISGELGMPGSKYRFVPKKGNMVFIATVLNRNLPDEVKLVLVGSTVDVLVTAKFVAISPGKTRFISEEIFTFKGLLNKITGLLAAPLVRKAHHKHMDDLKKFVTTMAG